VPSLWQADRMHLQFFRLQIGKMFGNSGDAFRKRCIALHCGLRLLSRTTEVLFSAKLISASERYEALQTKYQASNLITGTAASYEKSFTILTRENFCFAVDLTFGNPLCLQNVPRVFLQSFYACSNWVTESKNGRKGISSLGFTVCDTKPDEVSKGNHCGY
jgi:hypothetical protein